MWNGNPEYMSFYIPVIENCILQYSSTSMAKVDNFVSKNWHMECGRWICQTKRDHVKFTMTEGCGHYSLCFFKSLIPVLASSNSEDLCNKTILLHPGYAFLAVLMLNLQRQCLPSFFWTNTVGKAQGLLFSIDLGQQFGFSSTQQVLPSCVGLWMKCHLSTKSCLIIILFLQLVLTFQEISFLELWIIVMLAWTMQLALTGPVFHVVANGSLIFLSALVAFWQVLFQGISKKGLAADGLFSRTNGKLLYFLKCFDNKSLDISKISWISVVVVPTKCYPFSDFLHPSSTNLWRESN